ncbi:MAG TPA: hypothetical protein VLA72_10715 [Anaerolineales bacterium]|nr:hypothetical protein [Anaerolineales bacterium]
MNHNNPVTVESDDSKRRTIILLLSGAIISGICMISVGLYFWMSSNQSSSLSQFFSSSTVTPPPTRVPTSTPVPTEEFSLIAILTEQPMEKAKEPPYFASVQDTQSAFDQGTDHLESYASDYPELPEINQPGDIYTYTVFLFPSPIPLIWSYGWCTTTEEILEENFKHIQLDLIADDIPVPKTNIAVIDDVSNEGYPCRNFAVLINKWPTGLHRLQTRVTFTQDIDDGWDLYPAGTHTFEYLVPIYE